MNKELRMKGRDRNTTYGEITDNLCIYYPDPPLEQCYCDNCFYGRHKLALTIIYLLQELGIEHTMRDPQEAIITTEVKV